MPYGSVLIVDDVESNLYVAKGMMLPYGLKIETVVSGFEAINKIKSGKVYDIIFMDHMMPKMNGLEATRILREYGYTNPIVALTANAVMGSSEMFLSNGFDGYISKPIDIRELNNSLNRLVRDRQPSGVIEEVRKKAEGKSQTDTQMALISSSIAAASLMDIENAVTELDEILENLNRFGEADTELYTTIVHGMKSALINIGEKDLSSTALRLEKIGAKGNLSLIASETPAFIQSLNGLAKKIKPDEATGPEDISADDKAFLKEKLIEIKTACESIKKKAAKKALDELRQKTWPSNVKALLDELSEHLLLGEFKIAVNAVNEHINSEED
jgi:CheY-like chemotaxis protein